MRKIWKRGTIQYGPPTYHPNPLMIPKDEEGSEDDVDPTTQLASISFGTLAKAQKSLLKDKAKKNSKSKPNVDLSAIKESISALRKKAKLESGEESKSGRKPLPERHPHAPKRSDKNAPQELTAKKPVSRKREAVPVPFVKARDPRFDPALGTFNEAAFQKNYDFLEDYKESEAAALKDRLKKIKDAEEKERIKKKLAVYDNQKKSKAKKEEREAILREHKKRERQMVKEGKKPFFLKKCKFPGLSEWLVEMLMRMFSGPRESHLDTAILEINGQSTGICDGKEEETEGSQGEEEDAFCKKSCFIDCGIGASIPTFTVLNQTSESSYFIPQPDTVLVLADNRSCCT